LKVSGMWRDGTLMKLPRLELENFATLKL